MKTRTQARTRVLRTHEHEPEIRTQTRTLPSCLTAWLPNCLHTCLQALPALPTGIASRHCRSRSSLSLKSARPPPHNAKQSIIDAQGAIAQICAITSGSVAHLCDRCRNGDGCACSYLDSIQGPVGYEPSTLTTAPLRSLLPWWLAMTCENAFWQCLLAVPA